MSDDKDGGGMNTAAATRKRPEGGGRPGRAECGVCGQIVPQVSIRD
jgi:hypothetical protein